MLIYRLAFMLPAITAAVSVVLAWNAGLLRRPLVPIVWFLSALILQAIGALFSPAWAVGLVLQVALALYLIIKMKTSW
jgi:ABC-type sugar transport system permease subunit